MTNFVQPAVILTHESDLDGLLSGLLLQRLSQKLFGHVPRLISSHSDEWRRRQLPEGPAWIADLGFDPRMDQPNWLIIDHHVNKARPVVATLIHDHAKSAARLCYELCSKIGLASPALDRLIHLNDVSDLFLVDDPEFELACDYANLVKTYQFWTLLDLISGNPEQLLDHPLLEVMAAKRKVEDPIGLAWSKNHIVKISDDVGYVDIPLGNSNIIAYQMLCDKAVVYPVLASVFRGVNGVMIASFRSRGGQALHIAEKLNGGGHANAAAAPLPRSIRRTEDAIEYL
ncbi:MAG: DHH family phosphoesterase, partial [Verrucomicrobiae bacterium]|nr:DHH family phosphoesterase [Verrucomicrobiae bacterium]